MNTGPLRHCPTSHKRSWSLRKWTHTGTYMSMSFGVSFGVSKWPNSLSWERVTLERRCSCLSNNLARVRGWYHINETCALPDGDPTEEDSWSGVILYIIIFCVSWKRQREGGKRSAEWCNGQRQCQTGNGRAKNIDLKKYLRPKRTPKIKIKAKTKMKTITKEQDKTRERQNKTMIA